MIYQDVKRHLKGCLQKPSKDYIWSGHDNLVLLQYIQSRYSDDQIMNNVSEIRQAFRDFFEPVGNIVVRFKLDTGIAYKILPYHVSSKNSKHLSKVIDIVRQNRRNIEYPYKGRNDQIALLGKIRRHINSEIIETDEAVNKKELVRYAIKIALELDSRDVVVHLKRKYIIKIFKKNTLLNKDVIDPALKDDEERRFQGYDAEDMTAHYNELINDIDIESFLDNVMTLLFCSKLNFDEITNNYYEGNILSLVRNMIAQELKPYVSENEDYVMGLAGYIFRDNFEDVHKRIAIEIFEQISQKSKYAENFLGYYSGTIHIENGKKYAIPDLSTPDGKRWNMTSISATAIMWLRSRHKEVKLQVELDNVESNYMQVTTQYETVSQQFKQYADNINIYVEELATLDKFISDTRRDFKLKQNNQLNEKDTKQLSKLIHKNQQKVITLKEKILKIKPMKISLQDEARVLKIKYLEIKTKKQSLALEVRTLKKNLNVNSDAFHSVLGSLVKALMQRKKLITD